MAFRKSLVDRLLGLSKSSAAAAAGNPKSRCHSAVPPLSMFHRFLPCRSPPTAAAGLLRRFLHQDGAVAGALHQYRFSLPVGDNLVEKLRGLAGGERIRIDGLSPPMPPDRDRERDATTPQALAPITVEDARKVLRVSQTEAVKAKLRAISDSSISRDDFVRLCTDAAGPDGQRIARALDESGAVLVLGDVVFLRPEQVARAIESMIPLNLRRKSGAPAPPTVDDTTSVSAAEEEELRALEARRSAIESKAEAGVRRELWLGLAFLMAQTAGFARLTFWELSWDVMEPICFYVSTIYFMIGYAFFLRTSRDPSFEGIFESRLAARRRKLIKSQGFDLGRYMELRRAMGSDVGAGLRASVHLPSPPRPCLESRHASPCSQPSAALASSYCGCHRREGLLA